MLNAKKQAQLEMKLHPFPVLNEEKKEKMAESDE